LDSNLPCSKPQTIQHFKERFVLESSNWEAAQSGALEWKELPDGDVGMLKKAVQLAELGLLHNEPTSQLSQGVLSGVSFLVKVGGGLESERNRDLSQQESLWLAFADHISCN
jgi:hypothetical protein